MFTSNISPGGKVEIEIVIIGVLVLAIVLLLSNLSGPATIAAGLVVVLTGWNAARTYYRNRK
jgi:hypothetical protein